MKHSRISSKEAAS